jgi:hypothetical protein
MIGLDRFGASVIQEAKRAPTFRVLVLNLNETVGSVELHGGGKLLESQHPPGSVVEFERVPLVESNDYTLRLLDRNGIATYTSPPLQLWTPAPCGT